MSGKEYTLSLKVSEQIAELLIGDGSGLDAIAGAQNAHCKLEVVRHINSISPFTEIKLTASVWGLRESFEFLLNRIRIAEKLVDKNECNERRINDLQLALSDLQSRRSKELNFLKEDRIRLANQCGEVLIPRLNDSGAEDDTSSNDSSDSESLGFGKFSFITQQKRDKKLKKNISSNRCPVSTKIMKTYLSKFLNQVTLSPNEAAITFTNFMHHFITFLQAQSSQWAALRANQGFKDCLKMHLQRRWPELLVKTEGVQKVAVVIDFPQ